MQYEGTLLVNSLWAQQTPKKTPRRTKRMITDYDDFCLRGYVLNDDMNQRRPALRRRLEDAACVSPRRIVYYGIDR